MDGAYLTAQARQARRREIEGLRAELAAVAALLGRDVVVTLVASSGFGALRDDAGGLGERASTICKRTYAGVLFSAGAA